MWATEIKWLLCNYDEHLHWLDIGGNLYQYTREVAAAKIIAACNLAGESGRYRNTRLIYDAE